VPLAFSCRIYRYSVVFVSPASRDSTRLGASQSPGLKYTSRGPRIAPRDMPAVDVRGG